MENVLSQPAGVPSPRSICQLIHGICLGHREAFFGNLRSGFDSSQTPGQGSLHSTTPSATGEVLVHVCAGTLVAREEEQIGSTISVPTFAGRPSTMSSCLPVDIPQNSVVGQPMLWIKEVEMVDSVDE